MQTVWLNAVFAAGIWPALFVTECGIASRTLPGLYKTPGSMAEQFWHLFLCWWLRAEPHFGG
jgi:hypothetical protein